MKLSARAIVGGATGFVVYAGGLGAFALAAAQKIRTDSLRQTAVSLAGIAAVPVAWLVGAAAGRTAERWPVRAAVAVATVILLAFALLTWATLGSEVPG